MTSRGILLQLLMKRLDVDSRLATFRDRLLLQKGVYLLQECGMPTDFSYNWYLRGPYSPGLTEAAFEQVVKPLLQGDNTAEGYSLSDAAEGRLKTLARMRAVEEDAGLPAERWLELLASMHFYRHKMYFRPEDRAKRIDPAWLYERLPTAKKNIFSIDQAQRAADVLSDAGLWQDQ